MPPITSASASLAFSAINDTIVFNDTAVCLETTETGLTGGNGVVDQFDNSVSRPVASSTALTARSVLLLGWESQKCPSPS